MTADASKTMSGKRAQTQARLLRATLELMRERGINQLSLDGVAARAGLTKGAIYDNYESKDAMILAALASLPRGQSLFPWPTGRQGTVRQRLRRLGEAVLGRRPRPVFRRPFRSSCSTP